MPRRKENCVNSENRPVYVWDKAGIDFLQWFHWKRQSIYFVSLEKENMKLTISGETAFDHNAPLNRGVVSDQLVSGSAGVMVRRITYHCPIDGTVFKLLTNEMTLPPGLVVLIYKMRWDVEKAFDETKNRWRERKSWASSATAKTIQARLVCLTHNLALLMERRLEEDHAICNAPENQRRDKRLTKIEGQQAEKGTPLPQWYRDVQRATQRGVKFIRWLGNHLFLEVPWERALASLRRIYSLK